MRLRGLEFFMVFVKFTNSRLRTIHLLDRLCQKSKRLHVISGQQYRISKNLISSNSASNSGHKTAGGLGGAVWAFRYLGLYQYKNSQYLCLNSFRLCLLT